MLIQDRGRESRRQNIQEVVRKERQFGETDKKRDRRRRGMVTDERSHKGRRGAAGTEKQMKQNRTEEEKGIKAKKRARRGEDGLLPIPQQVRVVCK